MHGCARNALTLIGRGQKDQYTVYDIYLYILHSPDDSNRYFNYYFGDLPHIFRNNRTSIAVLDHSTTKTELENLADDIFQYYGLGCRSVTKLYLPEGYDIDKLFKSVFKYKNVINHNKYMNNYDYNRSIYLLQNIKKYVNNRTY